MEYVGCSDLDYKSGKLNDECVIIDITRFRNSTHPAAVQLFHAQRETKRFRLNQKVFVSQISGNLLYIRFKWRGRGRWVTGMIGRLSKKGDALNPVIGIITEITVKASFKKFIETGI